MKKLLILFVSAALLLAACGSSEFTVDIAEKPVYENETSSEMVLSITEDGEPVSGLVVTAELEMAKMDHGQISIVFEEQEEGLYKGAVTLPMGGEWLAEVNIQSGKEETKQLLTFDVEER